MKSNKKNTRTRKSRVVSECAEHSIQHPLLSAMQIARFRLDKEGNLICASAVLHKIFGCKNKNAFLKSEYFNEIKKSIISNRNNKNIFSSIHKFYKNNDDVFWVEIYIHKSGKNKNIFYDCVLIDVTHNILNEIKLHKYQTILNSTSDGICLCDNGIIVDINKPFLKMHDLTEKEVVGKSLVDLTENSYKNILINNLHKKIDHVVESVHVKKNKKTFPVEIKFENIKVDGKSFMLLSIKDISKRKHVEENLKAERIMVRTIIDSLPSVLYVKDKNGKYILNNIKHLRTIGAECQEEVVGKTAYDFYPKELAKQFHDDDITVLHYGKSIIDRDDVILDDETGEKRHHSTSKIPLKNDLGKIIGLIGISHDITLLKKAEEVALNEKNLLKTLIDHIPDHFYIKDASACFILNNIAHLKSLGVKEQSEVIGRNVFDFYPTELANKYYEDDMYVINTGNPIIGKEYVVVNKNTGDLRWQLTSIVPIKNNKGSVNKIACISHDITEQKNVQKAFKNERNLLRTLIDNLPDIIYAQDSEGRFLINNAEHLKAIGIERQEDIIGKKAFDFNISKETKKYFEEDFKIIKSGKPILNQEICLPSKQTGEERFYLTSKIPLVINKTNVIGLVCISRDITERKRAEEIIESERNLIRTIIDNLPVLIFCKDNKGRYLFDNVNHLKSIGVQDMQLVVGKQASDFYPKEIAELIIDDDNKVLKSGIPIFNKEEMIIHLDTGEKRWHLANKIPLLNKNGKVTGLVGIAIDITERKQIEEERERLIKNLQDALADIKTLSGLVPICSNCKKIRDDKGYWTQLEAYIQERSEARFSHGICPECMQKLYPEYDGKKE